MSTNATKPDGAGPVIASAETVRSLFRDIADDTCAAILRLDATVEDLETVAAYLAGEDDVMGKTGHPLSGVAAEVYELVTAEDAVEDDD